MRKNILVSKLKIYEEIQLIIDLESASVGGKK